MLCSLGKSLVVSHGSFSKLHPNPMGIPWVIVNGQIIVVEGKFTGKKPRGIF
ncbi:MAG: hypothetical protein AAFY45_23380 [Bacteroidota bacterium]